MKKTTLIKSLPFFIALFCAVNFGFGQIVAWEFATKLGNEATVNATTLAPNLNPSILSRGTGIDPRGLVDSFASDDFNTAGNTQANAILFNDYLEFQVSASSGYQVSLSTLDASFRRTSTGPDKFIWRYSTNGITFTDIGGIISYNTVAGNGTPQTQINLSAISALQNVPSGTIITFRLYGWGATAANGTFALRNTSGNDLSIGGTVTAAPACPTTVTWNGTWSGTPTASTAVIIDAPYDTGFGGAQTSFNACSLTVNSLLTVANNTYVEVQNDVSVSGEIYVDTQGAFVQRGNVGTFTLIGAGTASVQKQTPQKAKWYYYTYWSSPVVGTTIGTVFPDVDGDRRFWFNANNYLDQHTVGTTNGIPDDIDDDNNDWQYALASEVMAAGKGYAVTEARLHMPNATGSANFSGAFNTRNITTGISYNPLNTLYSWNFIGNPYPSAIDFHAFYLANSTIVEGLAYFWSQASPPLSTNPGNQQLNFNLNDYAIYSFGLGAGTKGGGPDTPTRYIPTGQGFFIPSKATGTVTFTNDMRMANTTSNSLFFKNTEAKSKAAALANANKLWLNLTSDNGVFGQILVGYVDGATNGLDALTYDAPKVPSDVPASLYWLIEESNNKFTIQGKAANSINEDETIQLGFKTTINVATLYTLSIAQLQGDFLTNNPVYLRDNLLNKVHDLSVSDYTFTSEVGEFNKRFEIVFTNKTLADTSFTTDANSVKITSLDNNSVSFKASNNLNISQVSILDMLGRTLYTFKGNSNQETYKLSNLNQNVFIAKITLSNGAVVTKKAVLK